MAIVTLKRFLTGMNGEETLREAVALLIEKLGDCAAIETEAQHMENFRKEITGIREALTPDLPPENLLILARSASQALAAYNRRVTKAVERQGSDFQVIIKMLQNSLMKIAGEKKDSVQGLSRISEELERGTAFKDLQSLKMHLGSCLSSLRTEIEREKTASEALIEKLQAQLGSFRDPERTPPVQQLDPVTELPGVEDCRIAFRQAVEAGTRHYAVAMVVNRVQRINARFGREAGNRMLCRFKEHVEHQFFASDRLFRWTGPAIVALLERAEAFDLVRAQVRRMLDAPVEENYEIGERSVLIPISAAWSLSMLTSAEAAEQQIQTFVASQGGREFSK